MNIPLPKHFYSFCRAEFLYNLEEHEGEFVECVVLGVRSVPNRALGFHILLKDGAQFAGLPIHALASSREAPKMPLSSLQLWDCFGHEVEAVEFTYLREFEVGAFIDGQVLEGRYIVSFDWLDNGFSEEPSQHKIMHLIALENGCYALQPNNRLRWNDRSFVEPFSEKPSYKVNTHKWHAEDSVQLGEGEEYLY